VVIDVTNDGSVAAALKTIEWRSWSGWPRWAPTGPPEAISTSWGPQVVKGETPDISRIDGNVAVRAASRQAYEREETQQYRFAF
jgi:hypothetical protein